MKASELRIGNFIENTDSQMASYMVVNADVIKQNEHTMYASLEPLPLTEAWLLKFGFNEYMSKSDLRISIGGGVLMQFHFGVNQIECWIGDEISKTDVIYVHQLQNLYFALTGEELTRKP